MWFGVCSGNGIYVWLLFGKWYICKTIFFGFFTSDASFIRRNKLLSNRRIWNCVCILFIAYTQVWIYELMYEHYTYLVLVIWMHITKVGNSINSTRTDNNNRKKNLSHFTSCNIPITITLRLQCWIYYSIVNCMVENFCSTITHWCTPTLRLSSISNCQISNECAPIQTCECNSIPLMKWVKTFISQG